MLRHWDPVKFTSIKVINVSDDGKMDPSISYSDDKKRSTGMTRRTFHHVIPAHDQIFLFDPRLAGYASSNFNNI